MQNLQLTHVPHVQRFLGFYFEVLKEQSSKKLSHSKAQFYKVSKDHLDGMFKVWQFFNEQQTQMIFDTENNRINLANYNESLFAIASKLDKCLMLIVACGFSINNLVQEPKNNGYVEKVTYLIQKLKMFVECCEQIHDMPDCPEKQKFKQILVGQVKTFLKRLSDLQAFEPLLMFNSLD